MSHFAVTKAEEVNEAAPSGALIVARFNLTFGGVFLNGCALVHRGDHGWSLWGPSKSVQFNRRVRKEIKIAVLQAIGMEIPPQMAEAD